MSVFLSYLLLLSSIYMNAFTVVPNEWVLVKEEGGVKVYTRKVEGEVLKEFRAETIIDAKPTEMLDLLIEGDQNHTWMDKVKACEVLKRISANEIIIYNLIDSPWPATDRDMIVHFQVEKSGDDITVNMTGMSDFIPEKPNLVRIPRYTGSWIIKSAGEGKSSVINQGMASPGGSIPDWLANSSVVDTPLATLKNLRARFKK